MIRLFAVASMIGLTLVPPASADVLPWGRRPLMFQTPPHNFAIERDANLLRAKLIIPRSMLPDGGRAAASPASLPVGVAMTCGFVLGGLWLARIKRRLLVAVAVALLVAGSTTTVVWANAPPPWRELRPLDKADKVSVWRPAGGMPSEVDVYIDDNAAHVRLILPAKGRLAN